MFGDVCFTFIWPKFEISLNIYESNLSHVILIEPKIFFSIGSSKTHERILNAIMLVGL